MQHPGTSRGSTGDRGPINSDEVQTALERRKRAAAALEADALTDVPLLYGSPENGYGTRGDPGIVLARLHRENMLRRHGYLAAGASGDRSEVELPFERATGALAIVALLIFMLWK